MAFRVPVTVSDAGGFADHALQMQMQMQSMHLRLQISQNAEISEVSEMQFLGSKANVTMLPLMLPLPVAACCNCHGAFQKLNCRHACYQKVAVHRASLLSQDHLP